MKRNPKNIFSLININSGENLSIPIIKMHATTIVTNPASVRQVFILLFLLSELGRYLINPVFRPKREKEIINPIAEIIVVANPISWLENNLAHIIQKKNPKTAITPELVIINREFL